MLLFGVKLRERRFSCFSSFQSLNCLIIFTFSLLSPLAKESSLESEVQSFAVSSWGTELERLVVWPWPENPFTVTVVPFWVRGWVLRASFIPVQSLSKLSSPFFGVTFRKLSITPSLSAVDPWFVFQRDSMSANLTKPEPFSSRISNNVFK